MRRKQLIALAGVFLCCGLLSACEHEGQVGVGQSSGADIGKGPGDGGKKVNEDPDSGKDDGYGPGGKKGKACVFHPVMTPEEIEACKSQNDKDPSWAQEDSDCDGIPNGSDRKANHFPNDSELKLDPCNGDMDKDGLPDSVSIMLSTLPDTDPAKKFYDSIKGGKYKTLNDEESKKYKKVAASLTEGCASDTNLQSPEIVGNGGYGFKLYKLNGFDSEPSKSVDLDAQIGAYYTNYENSRETIYAFTFGTTSFSEDSFKLYAQSLSEGNNPIVLYKTGQTESMIQVSKEPEKTTNNGGGKGDDKKVENTVDGGVAKINVQLGSNQSVITYSFTTNPTPDVCNGGICASKPDSDACKARKAVCEQMNSSKAVRDYLLAPFIQGDKEAGNQSLRSKYYGSEVWQHVSLPKLDYSENCGDSSEPVMVKLTLQHIQNTEFQSEYYIVTGAVVCKNKVFTSKDNETTQDIANIRTQTDFDWIANGSLISPARGILVNHQLCQYSSGATGGKIDFLWVLDNSGSLADEQKGISKTASLFFNKLKNSGVDFSIGVTSTDAYLTDESPCSMMFYDENQKAGTLLYTAPMQNNRPAYLDMDKLGEYQKYSGVEKVRGHYNFTNYPNSNELDEKQCLGDCPSVKAHNLRTGYNIIDVRTGMRGVTSYAHGNGTNIALPTGAGFLMPSHASSSNYVKGLFSRIVSYDTTFENDKSYGNIHGFGIEDGLESAISTLLRIKANDKLDDPKNLRVLGPVDAKTSNSFKINSAFRENSIKYLIFVSDEESRDFKTITENTKNSAIDFGASIFTRDGTSIDDSKTESFIKGVYSQNKICSRGTKFDFECQCPTAVYVKKNNTSCDPTKPGCLCDVTSEGCAKYIDQQPSDKTKFVTSIDKCPKLAFGQAGEGEYKDYVFYGYIPKKDGCKVTNKVFSRTANFFAESKLSSVIADIYGERLADKATGPYACTQNVDLSSVAKEPVASEDTCTSTDDSLEFARYDGKINLGNTLENTQIKNLDLPQKDQSDTSKITVADAMAHANSEFVAQVKRPGFVFTQQTIKPLISYYDLSNSGTYGIADTYKAHFEDPKYYALIQQKREAAADYYVNMIRKAAGDEDGKNLVGFALVGSGCRILYNNSVKGADEDFSYTEVARKLSKGQDGKSAAICNEGNYDAIVNNILDDAIGRVSSVALKSLPIVSTLRVRYKGHEIPPVPRGNANDVSNSPYWVYDSIRNSLTFYNLDFSGSAKGGTNLAEGKVPDLFITYRSTTTRQD